MIITRKDHSSDGNAYFDVVANRVFAVCKLAAPPTGGMCSIKTRLDSFVIWLQLVVLRKKYKLQ
jgi:hypothetical protein